jgi:hypothetical protein
MIEQKDQDLHVSQHSSNEVLAAALSVRDGNYLIAAFMGYEDYKQTGAVIKDASIKFVLCYDSCWSELMPVIEKINSIWFNLPIARKEETKENFEKIKNRLCYVNISATHYWVIKFIQWHNRQTVSVG